MDTQTTQPTPAPVLDFAAAILLRSHYDEARQMTWLTLLYPGTTGGYEIQGLADGRDASCTCPGYRRHRRCKHSASISLFWAEIQRERYAKLPTAELTDYVRWYAAQPGLTPDERVVQGAIRAVLAARGVRVAPTAAVAERARAAQEELYG